MQDHFLLPNFKIQTGNKTIDYLEWCVIEPQDASCKVRELASLW